MKRIASTLSGLLLAAGLSAQGGAEEPFEDVPLPPELPDPLESGQPIEPEVTIIRREKEVVEEYRINGNLYMVKVTPVGGAVYYLMDTDGDGRLEDRRSEIYSDGQVPQWVLFRW